MGESHWTLSASVLPTPPSSPRPDDGGGGAGRTSEEEQGEKGDPEEQDKQAAAANDQPALSRLGYTEWLRMMPVYPNLNAALDDIGYEKWRTSPYQNCCLLFAFLLCTKQITECAQYTR